MKKRILFIALVALSAGTITSCAKSTKGKIDGDWKVDSMMQQSTSTDYDGSKFETKTQLTQTNITITEITPHFGVGEEKTTNTGIVSEASMTLKKDGTWKRTISYKFSDGYSAGDVVYPGSRTITKTESGNWDFLNGVGEFKKNERICLSTLNLKTIQIEEFLGESQTTTNNETYSEGESKIIYVITESKKKSLKMEMEGSSTSTRTDANGTTTSTTITSNTISMTAK